MTIEFSRRLAIVFGVALPIVETIRRWSQLGEPSVWPFWLDDFVIAAFLLYGAHRAARSIEAGRIHLASAWGVALGMGYGSFFGQLMRLDEADPGPLPATWVVTIKGVGLLLVIAALVGCLRTSRSNLRVH